ncbi:MAG: hypothetical protein WC208_10450 [Gallionella sp.]
MIIIWMFKSFFTLEQAGEFLNSLPAGDAKEAKIICLSDSFMHPSRNGPKFVVFYPTEQATPQEVQKAVEQVPDSIKP